jgi:hypothetical protein
MIRSINKNIIIRGGINQVPQCVRRVTLSEVHIACHNVDFAQPSYELRCPVDTLTIRHLSKSQDIGKFLLITYEG